MNAQVVTDPLLPSLNELVHASQAMTTVAEHPLLLDLCHSRWRDHRCRAASEQPPAVVLAERKRHV